MESDVCEKGKNGVVKTEHQQVALRMIVGGRLGGRPNRIEGFGRSVGICSIGSIAVIYPMYLLVA